MKRPRLGETGTTFGQILLTLHRTLGLTQAELAGQLGVSRQAMREWEVGNRYPRTGNLKQLIELALRGQVFSVGQEEEEIRRLWKEAHQNVQLDDAWLQKLLAGRLHKQELIMPFPEVGSHAEEPVAPAAGPQVDWGEAQVIPNFYGREQEQEVLSKWIVQERCRVVSVLGMGGIGKSALVVTTMSHLAEQFEVVLFRSLRDARPCEAVLDDWLQVLSPHFLQCAPLPVSLEQRITLLLEHLARRRTLLVLDNLESLLDEGEQAGRFRGGFEGYEHLLSRITQGMHQSCLLLTSREQAMSVRLLESRYAFMRSLRLCGLDLTAGERLLSEKEVRGTEEEKAQLIELYAGNPLALRIVSETIADYFAGQIELFLAEDTIVFGSMTTLLDEHWVRLSRLEQSLLRWLAILREPVTLEEIRAVMVGFQPQGMLNALDRLFRRALIERGHRASSFTLQSVVLEYVTAVLIADVSKEIHRGQGKLDLLIQHGLELAQSKEEIRQTQERLLLRPILAHAESREQGPAAVEELLLWLLNQVREWEEDAQGYGPANLITLLRLSRGHLRGANLSQLVIRNAYLQGVEMQDASMCGALIQETLFTEALDAIWSVAISPDGKWWAAGSRCGSVRVWEKEGRVLHLSWQAHADITMGLAFSPDGCTLASVSWDGTIKLWEVERGALLWTRWQTGGVNDITFSPDGRLLATSGTDACVHLRDPSTGKSLWTLPHSRPLFAGVWSPDGRWLVSCDWDGIIRVWEMQESQSAVCVQTIVAHSGWIMEIAFAPDSQVLASAGWDGTLKLWEIPSGRLLQTFEDHTDRLYCLAWSPDGRTIASGSFDQTIRLWDVQQRICRAVLYGHTHEVFGLAFTPESHLLLSSGNDGTLRVWSVANGQCLRIIQGYAVSVYDVGWSPDGTQLVSGDTEKRVTIWDINGEKPPRILRGHHSYVMGAQWSPDGRWVASSEWDNVIRVWDPVSEVCYQSFESPTPPLLGLRWSPDGHQLACATFWREVCVWNLDERRWSWIGQASPSPTRCLAWSPDGALVASGDDAGNICLWEAADGRLRLRIQGHQGIIGGMAWSPDGTRLVSAGGNKGSGELLVWDLQSSAPVRRFEGHCAMVTAVDWSPSADLLISGDSEGVLRWWDVQHGECVRILDAHHGMIRAIRISPDGQTIASCGDDNTLQLWKMHSGERMRILRHDRPYERLDITEIRGLNEAQKATLRLLGAIESPLVYNM